MPTTPFEKVFVVTLWSGGRAARKWKTLERPATLAQGTGVSFTCLETHLTVEVIGSVSVEEYEQGMDVPDSDAPVTPGPEDGGDDDEVF